MSAITSCCSRLASSVWPLARRMTARFAWQTSVSGWRGPSVLASRSRVSRSWVSASASRPRSCRQFARLTAQDKVNGWSSPSAARSPVSVRSASSSAVRTEPVPRR